MNGLDLLKAEVLEEEKLKLIQKKYEYIFSIRKLIKNQIRKKREYIVFLNNFCEPESEYIYEHIELKEIDEILCEFSEIKEAFSDLNIFFNIENERIILKL